jgi:acyl-coenzyme A synthetase/AMP-(fatty) acid ligase
MQDAQMAVVLTQPELQWRVSGTAADVVSLDRDWVTIGQESTENLAEDERAGEHLGHVIYTSGSTGRPKGVMVERGALAAHTRAMIDVYGLGAQDRVMQFSQYSVDASLEQILPALAGKITFYWAREEPGIARTWQPVTGRKEPADVEEHVVRGTLMSSVTDHVQDVAETLSESLSRVEQNACAVTAADRAPLQSTGTS